MGLTHKQRVLQLLKDGKPHSHHELYGLGCVAHSRISDLRRDGHRIESWRKGSIYVYQLVLNEAAPSQAAGPPCEGLSAASLSTPPSNPIPFSLEAAASSSPTRSDRDGDGVLTLFGTAV